MTAALWIGRHFTIGVVPGLQRPLWAGWFDQSRYLASALALARGDLTASAHWHPLTYPLLAAPFAWLVPRDPFFLLDLALFLVTVWAFRRVCARLGIGPWTATWCFLATALIQVKVAGSWVNPWTSTLSAALIWSLIDRVLAVGPDPSRCGARSLALAGALMAALPAVRPANDLLSVTSLMGLAVFLGGWRRLAGRLLALAVGERRCAWPMLFFTSRSTVRTPLPT